ncbi:Protein RTA1 [Lachnellula suecica]|uniref:Protein RTA1 n=1 Tax=Lachnellula suecica TaxID=602035 RepID=A0A8T9BT62_9HELO|nr:Protein RTA1 [Lachnellula suecica]
MAKLEEYKDGHYLWNYVPSMVGAVIFIILFFAATVFHVWRMFKTRTWFCIPFALGCLSEAIGYCARAASVNDTGTLGPYLVQSIFILIPPALFAASIYMTLGRIMRYVKGEHHSVIRINWLTKIFVLGDWLSFMVQGNAAGLLFKTSTMRIGQGIILAGLFIQIISFGCFFIVAVIFQLRMRKNPTRESYNVEASWERYLYMLYAVSVLILIRSIFRVVEYIQGQTGYSMKNEWTLYAFDSIPMVVVTVVFFIWYPSRIRIPPGGHVEDDSDGIQMRLDSESGERRRPKSTLFTFGIFGLLGAISRRWGR